MSQRTDGDLVADYARCRNDEAFAELVRRHGPMVLNTCRRTAYPDTHLAEDAFQATFLVLAIRAGTVSPPERVGAWLHGVAVNVSRKALSWSHKLAPTEPADLDRFPSQRPEPDPDHFALRSVIDEALVSLPAKYRSPVVLCELEGQSRAQAAQTLGLNEGTLSGRLARAKKLLAERLTRRGVTLPAAGVAGVLLPGETTAVVPALLVAATTRSAALVSAGLAAEQAASAPVATLVRGVSLPMSTTFKLLAAGAAAIALVVAAISLSGFPERDVPPISQAGPVVVAKPPQVMFAPVPVPQQRWGEVHTLAHKHAITALALGADFVATGDEGGVLVLWDPTTGAVKDELLDGKGRKGKPIDQLQPAPDGTWLYLATEHAESAHQVRVAREDRTFPSMGGKGNWVTYGVTADGAYWIERIAGGNLLLLVKNDLGSKKMGGFPAAMFPHDDKIDFVAAGGADAIVSISGGVLRRWSINSKEVLWQVELDRFESTALAVSSDGKSIAVGGSDGTTRLFEGESGKSLRTLKGHDGAVRAVAFGADGKRLVTGGADGKARVYDPGSGKELAVLKGHEDAIAAVAVGPDGRTIATGSADRTVKLWRVRTHPPVRGAISTE
jgi:RNA polymerase sigma factor (sigma-70 family)